MALVLRLGHWELYFGVRRGYPWPMHWGRMREEDEVLGFGLAIEFY